MEDKKLEQIVEQVTQAVLKSLDEQGGSAQARILVLSRDPKCPIAAHLNKQFHAQPLGDLDEASRFDFVLLPTWYLDKLRGGEPSPAGAAGGDVLDFRGQRLLHERELRDQYTASTKAVLVGKQTIITSLATDLIRKRGLELRRTQ